MAEKPDDLQEVRLRLEVDGKPPERNEEGVPLVDGRPINELLKSDPRFFAQMREAFGKALAEALGVDPDAEPRNVTYTRTRDVDWDHLKTLGPDGLLKPDASAKANKDVEQK
jgi:hypothetical protein